jgi:UDP-2,4-diacetamido-2,4,6-trideoxy-beta-L-altropyranose hydrolase
MPQTAATPERPIAVFRADGDARMGIGHLARCSALARHLAALNWDCRLATCSEGPWPDGLVEFEDVLRLDRGEGSDSRAVQRAAPQCELLVVDHYGLGADFERGCRPWARRVLAVDDLADRAHDANMLLDAAAEELDARYRELAPGDCEILCGPDHALLRPEFFARRLSEGRRADGPDRQRAIVALGSGPIVDLTAAAVRAVHESAPATAIDVVLPPSVPSPRFDGVPADAVSVHRGHSNLMELMSAASFAVGACGVTAWERCALGLASVAVVTAGNQSNVADTLRRTEAAIVLDADAESLRGAVARLAGDTQLRERIAAAALRLCDGLGAARLAAVLDADPRARDGRPVRLRPVRMSDAPLMLQWQSAPATRAFSHDPNVPTAAEHEAWIGRKLADPCSILAMVLHAGQPAGVLRLDRLPQSSETWLISIYVAPDRYRLGLAGCALALVHRVRPHAAFVADVLPGNAASHALFRAAGYVWRDERYERAPFTAGGASESAA